MSADNTQTRLVRMAQAARRRYADRQRQASYTALDNAIAAALSAALSGNDSAYAAAQKRLQRVSYQR